LTHPYTPYNQGIFSVLSGLVKTRFAHRSRTT